MEIIIIIIIINMVVQNTKVQQKTDI